MTNLATVLETPAQGETGDVDDDGRWRAVVARDGRFDGAFAYAVRSTGIYCRPSCASRRPRRDQVVYFARAEDAERAGFRPCLRCEPKAEVTRVAGWIERVCRHIEAHLDGPLRLAELGAAAGVSPHHLQRTFKRAMGITPREYADARRLEALKTHLRSARGVTDAVYEAGYGSGSRVYERADGHLGMTPATYRRGGRGMRIAWTVVDSPLGRLLVGATERGVSAVCLGDSDTSLEKALHEEYPAAEIRRDDSAIGPWVRAIVRHLEGREPRLDLAVDVQATAFQRRVWQELRAIPFGQTRSYRDVARAMGRPLAVRAVARACATNPVALVIPCHRVVPAAGGLGGYRWGVERKRALLAGERDGTGESARAGAQAGPGGGGERGLGTSKRGSRPRRGGRD